VKPAFKKPPRKYQPRGFDILYEDIDLLIGNKAAGFLTVAAQWNRDSTIHSALNHYLRKGNPKSKKCAYVVHRLDQGTTGVLVFAKSEAVQQFLKNDWKSTVKTYYAIVHGRMAKKSGILSSFLSEDEDYVMHSSERAGQGKLAETEYLVLKETPEMSLVKIGLLTGRKNQIRVHFADAGHPVVGDTKYGKVWTTHKKLALHSASIEFTHPFSRLRTRVEAPVPEHFRKLIAYAY
jgi:tRNA pseudouridine32 synthase/23S rRNA pseudouridine746 synthase/23S rRNA pseudouridine1911/1915/1917 synthase